MRLTKPQPVGLNWICNTTCSEKVKRRRIHPLDPPQGKNLKKPALHRSISFPLWKRMGWGRYFTRGIKGRGEAKALDIY
jgi:hypothetical protein